jgi:hypothetical protein
MGIFDFLTPARCGECGLSIRGRSYQINGKRVCRDCHELKTSIVYQMTHTAEGKMLPSVHRVALGIISDENREKKSKKDETKRQKISFGLKSGRRDEAKRETENKSGPEILNKQRTAEAQVRPITVIGREIFINSASFLGCGQNPFQIRAVIPIKEKEPSFQVLEDGVKLCQFTLETEGGEDFTGKSFHTCITLLNNGNPASPALQIDGFISDTDEPHSMHPGEIGYRIEGRFLNAGGEISRRRREEVRGEDLVARGLKFVGRTTPINVRLVGFCDECEKSFCFHGYMAQQDVAYSDDGLDCCQISDWAIDPERWTYKKNGKTFRYYNSFCCPHCGATYIDYKNHHERKNLGVCACVHLGKKLYNAN